MINPQIEAYAKAKSLVNYLELHDEISYEKAKAVIEGVNAIFTVLDRRGKGGKHARVSRDV